MRVETEQRRSVGFETRPVTDHAGSVVQSNAQMPAGLDWSAFSAACFPGRRRHDLEALTAYGAYRSAQEVDAHSSHGLARIEAERGRAGSTALQGWEDEGGAAF
jgi:hypothetical protein